MAGFFCTRLRNVDGHDATVLAQRGIMDTAAMNQSGFAACSAWGYGPWTSVRWLRAAQRLKSKADSKCRSGATAKAADFGLRKKQSVAVDQGDL